MHFNEHKTDSRKTQDNQEDVVINPHHALCKASHCLPEQYPRTRSERNMTVVPHTPGDFPAIPVSRKTSFCSTTTQAERVVTVPSSTSQSREDLTKVWLHHCSETVKEECGYRAVLALQGASATRTAAAKFLDTTSIFLGMWTTFWQASQSNHTKKTNLTKDLEDLVAAFADVKHLIV